MVRKTLLAAFLTLICLPAGAADKPQNIVDNARVTVRDVTLAPGDSGVTTDPAHPFVILVLDGGTIRTTKNGKASMATYAADNAIYGAKGAAEKLEAVSGHPHFALVSLKEDAATPLIANPSKLPLAYPRPGSKKVLDNDRVTVWSYAWTTKPTPMHFHDKDVVVAYHQNGSVSSTTPDGKTTATQTSAGTIRFTAGNRTHFEKLVSGQQSAIVMELK